MAAERALRQVGWRWGGTILLLLLALQAVRSAIVAAEAECRPALAHAVWPDHPAPLLAEALAGIGEAARAGRPPGPELLAKVEQAGRAASLDVEPLQVAAAAKLAAGDLAGGECLLRAAIRRDARAPAPHFLLADLYIRQNRIAPAMKELAALDRRLGNVSEAFAPAVARYLVESDGLRQMAPVLSANPPLRAAVMADLSNRPDGSRLLLALAQPGDRFLWLPAAIERLIAGGKIGDARALLARTGGADLTRLQPWSDRPAAFGWRFPAMAGGAAEPVTNGPLNLIFYGREDAILGEHLLLLPPGNHRLGQNLAPAVPPGTFEWRMQCLGRTMRQLTAIPLFPGRDAAEVIVPADCQAQKLQLVGRAGDFPRTVNAALSDVTITLRGARQ